jgi:hypothetical protein
LVLERDVTIADCFRKCRAGRELAGLLLVVACMGTTACRKPEEPEHYSPPIPRDAWVRFRSSFDAQWKPLPEHAYARVSGARKASAIEALKDSELVPITDEEAAGFASDAVDSGGSVQCYLVRAVSLGNCKLDVLTDGDNLAVTCGVLGSANAMERDALVACPSSKPRQVFVEYSVAL